MLLLLVAVTILAHTLDSGVDPGNLNDSAASPVIRQGSADDVSLAAVHRNRSCTTRSPRSLRYRTCSNSSGQAGRINGGKTSPSSLRLSVTDDPIVSSGNPDLI